MLYLLRHYLEHWMAVDSQSTGFYMFWSGIGAASAGWCAILLAYRVFRAELRLELRSIALEERSLELEERLLALETSTTATP